MKITERIKKFFLSWYAIKQSFFAKRLYHGNIQVNGDDFFCSRMQSSLDLLEKHHKTTYELINENIAIITQSKFNFLSPSKIGGGLFLIADEYVKSSSMKWLASFIACNSFRAKLYKDFYRKNKISPPVHIYSKKTAWNFMYDCLKKLGGSYEALKQLEEFIQEEDNNA